MPAPTVVLVHGAFADASTYQPVTRALLDDGVPVVAVAVPNRSLTGDAEYVRSALAVIEGPILLVGHSYGGAVITVAGVADNVVALLYLSGYALAEGESLAEMQGQFPDSELPPALAQRPFPGAGAAPSGVDVTIQPGRFAAVVAADVDPRISEVLAVSQRPLAAAAFAEAAPVAAWRSRPTWGVVCTADHAITPQVQRFGYERAQATIREVESSHLVMLSQPGFVVDLIKQIIESLN